VTAGLSSSTAAHAVWTLHRFCLSILCRSVFHDVWRYCLQFYFLTFPRRSEGQSRLDVCRHLACTSDCCWQSFESWLKFQLKVWKKRT